MADDAEVEVMSAEQVRQKYMRRYPETNIRTYDALIAAARPPNHEKHIEHCIEMMKERDMSEDQTLRDILLTLASTHLKVYDLVRMGKE